MYKNARWTTLVLFMGIVLFSGCGKEQEDAPDTEKSSSPFAREPISRMKITSPSQIPDSVTPVYTNLSEIKKHPGRDS